MKPRAWLHAHAHASQISLSPLQPLCGLVPVHLAAAGASGEPWMIPAWLNEPFIGPFQCPSCFHRAIMETPLSSQL